MKSGSSSFSWRLARPRKSPDCRITPTAALMAATIAIPSRAGVMTAYEGFTDSASPDVIDQTEEKWKHFVRFYFRPRTPTLYRNEGFRPVKRRVLGGAHCPMPVYLFFDFEELICREDAAFSYGSLARPDTLVYDTGDAFEKLPFDLVYHDSRFEKDVLERIVAWFDRYTKL